MKSIGPRTRRGKSALANKLRLNKLRLSPSDFHSMRSGVDGRLLVAFILGAGASKPYGFPLGAKLFKRLPELIGAEGQNEIGTILDELGFDISLRKIFAKQLRESGRGSV